jgi:hypothetical protein
VNDAGITITALVVDHHEGSCYYHPACAEVHGALPWATPIVLPLGRARDTPCELCGYAVDALTQAAEWLGKRHAEDVRAGRDVVVPLGLGTEHTTQDGSALADWYWSGRFHATASREPRGYEGI